MKLKDAYYKFIERIDRTKFVWTLFLFLSLAGDWLYSNIRPYKHWWNSVGYRIAYEYFIWN